MNIKVKRSSIIPLFAGALILLHYILTTAVTPPVNGGLGIRYLVYWFLVIVGSIGTNLIAIYLGYIAKLNKQPWRKLSKLAFYFLTIGLISIILSFVFFKKFVLRDLWLLFFPISHHDFPFAASILVWYILGPFLVEACQKLSKSARHSLALVLFWFILVLPFLFAKPLWGISDANNLIWVGTLFVFGILVSDGEFKWLDQYWKAWLIIIIGLALALITVHYLPIAQSNGNLQGRFYANYSLVLALISLAVFGILRRWLSQHLIKLGNFSLLNWFTFVVYIFSSLPLVTSHMVTTFKLSDNLTSIKWLLWIVIYFLIAFVGIAFLTILLQLASKLKIFQRLIKQLSLNRFSDLQEIPQLILRLFRENWRLLLVILCGFIFTVIQMAAMRLTSTPFSWTLFNDLFVSSSSQIFLNIIIFAAFFLLLFSLTNRFWPALLFTSGVSIFIAVAEFLKTSLREEPILPADLKMVTAISEIAQMISPIIIVVAAIVLVLLVITSIVLQRHIGGMYPQPSWKRRVATILLLLVFFSGSFWVNHTNSVPSIIFKAFNVQPWFYNQSNGAILNGPVVQFINNLDVKIMDKPQGYSKEKIQKVMRKYDKQAALINQKRTNTLDNQTMIFVLSESFSDPNRVPEMKVKTNPMPYLTKLKKQTDSGLMISSGYGGGTANMEWQSLTGLSISNLSPTLPTPYSQLVVKQKIAPAFTDLFDSKIAIHPYNAKLYNRKEVFKKFGFQKFYYEGSKNKLSYTQRLGTSPHISDQSAYQQTLKVAKKAQSGSRFIQLSTMQNHMPYTNYYSGKKFKITGNAFEPGNADSVQTYTQGVHYTDQATKKFIQKIDRLNKPVTVVWYGDHLAALYKSSLMNKYPVQLHETDYFIYNNQSHKLSYTNRLVSPYSFSALALANSDSKVTPYYALVTKVTDNLPAMTTNPATTQSNVDNGSNVFINQKSQLVKYKSLTKAQRKLYHDYQLIQYDLVAGEQYSAKWAQQKVK